MTIDSYAVKYCPKCKQTKSFDDFYYREAAADKCSPQCKSCRKLYLKGRWTNSSNCRRLYGITLKQKEEMIKQQKGCCYLCDNALPTVVKQQHIDHDKITGKVYGIACHSCNAGVAFFKHDPLLMIKVAKRMTRFRC